MDLKAYKRPAYAVLFNSDPFMRKDYEQRALNIIDIPLPPGVSRSDALTKLLEKIIVDLQKFKTGTKPTPSATAQTAPWHPRGIYAKRFNRPVPCGVSIGRFDGATGTLGCVVRNGKDVYILSSSHLLVGPEGKKGDKILQPSPWDGGKLETDVIATLERWVKPPGNNLDAAIARLIDPSAVQPTIKGIGALKGISEPRRGTRVRLAGRTSGVTHGKITAIAYDVRVSGYSVGSEQNDAGFTDVIVSSGMSEGGDTGAILVDERNNALGMCFAGSAEFSLFLPIRKILDALKVDLVTGE
jgi:hypothetical protein